MIFNKEITSQSELNEPSVIFRQIPNTFEKPRYQGSINTAGIKLLKSLVADYTGLKIVFSDEHSTIGFKPLSKKGTKAVFGATRLFKNLKLVKGKHYKLTVPDYSTAEVPIAVIDSSEHKKTNR